MHHSSAVRLASLLAPLFLILMLPVGSVAEVITEVVARGLTSPTPVNLAFGTRYSLLEVIALLESILGHSLERAHTDTRAGDVRDSQADQSAVRALVPDLEPVDLETGLRQTIDWFRTLA